MGLLPATSSMNSNQFEFVGPKLQGPKFWLLQLDFLTKMGSLQLVPQD